MAINLDTFPESDGDWSESNWEDFLKFLVEHKIVSL